MAVADAASRRSPTAVKPDGALKFHSLTKPASPDSSTHAAGGGAPSECAVSVDSLLFSLTMEPYPKSQFTAPSSSPPIPTLEPTKPVSSKGLSTYL